MAHSLHTDFFSLTDQTARPSSPRAVSGQFGAAFRELLGNSKEPATSDTGEAIPASFDKLPDVHSAHTAPDQNNPQFADIRLHGQNPLAEYRHSFTSIPDASDEATGAGEADGAELVAPVPSSPEDDSIPAKSSGNTPDAEDAHIAADKELNDVIVNMRDVSARTPPEADVTTITGQRANAVILSDRTNSARPQTAAEISTARAVSVPISDAGTPPSRQTGDETSNRATVGTGIEAKITTSSDEARSRDEVRTRSVATLPQMAETQEPITPDRDIDAPHPTKFDKSSDFSSENRSRADNTSFIAHPVRAPEPVLQSETAVSRSEPLFATTVSTVNTPAPITNAARSPFMPGMQAHASMVATPPEVVDIIQSRIAGNEGSERITVQLDPPELGRVSIDFKFDAQGLQHVTVTGDTPEALKQLRQLHFQLTQALEQNGLTAQDMSFRQNNSQQGQPHFANPPSGTLTLNEEDIAAQILPAVSAPSRLLAAGAGLDIKL